jgi:uncharacterized membrane-anchored protein
MTSMHFHAWRLGLKTGQYYFRSRPARDAIKFTVDVASLLQATESGNTGQIMDVLNTTANKKAKSSNIVRKKVSTAPSASTEQDKIRKMSEPATIKTQAPVAVPEPAQEEEESSDEHLVCENCSG